MGMTGITVLQYYYNYMIGNSAATQIKIICSNSHNRQLYTATLMKRKFGQWWNCNITESSCPDPAHGNFLSFSGRTRQRCFENADWGYVNANTASRSADDSGENG